MWLLQGFVLLVMLLFVLAIFVQFLKELFI